MSKEPRPVYAVEEPMSLAAAFGAILWLIMMLVVVVPFHAVRVIWFAIFRPDEPRRIKKDETPQDEPGPGNWRQR